MKTSKSKLALLCIFLFCSMKTMAFTVTLTQQLNACDRVLTANISGGSGNYQIAWGSSGGCGIPQNYSQPTLTISNCGSDGTYFVFVLDQSTSTSQYAQISVSKVLIGSFSISIPNVFTPNGDGINDTFNLYTASGGNGPINAHTVAVTINNRWGQTIYTSTYTNFGGSGINAAFPIWDGAGFSSSTYYYYVTVTNCSSSQSYNGWFQLLQ